MSVWQRSTCVCWRPNTNPHTTVLSVHAGAAREMRCEIQSESKWESISWMDRSNRDAWQLAGEYLEVWEGVCLRADFSQPSPAIANSSILYIQTSWLIEILISHSILYVCKKLWAERIRDNWPFCLWALFSANPLDSSVWTLAGPRIFSSPFLVHPFPIFHPSVQCACTPLED
jgi:hypothetical protein